MKECQAIESIIFIDATFGSACEFPLAHEPLNLERLKTEMLADDARVDLNEAIMHFNLVHDKCPQHVGHREEKVILLHLPCKPGIAPASLLALNKLVRPKGLEPLLCAATWNGWRRGAYRELGP